MVTPNEYDKGDRVDITTDTVFQDANAVPFDPDNVTFEVIDPSGTKTTYLYDQDGTQAPQIAKNGTGDYTLTIDVDIEGDWYYRIFGEQDGGENRGADEGRFNVIKTKF